MSTSKVEAVFAAATQEVVQGVEAAFNGLTTHALSDAVSTAESKLAAEAVTLEAEAAKLAAEIAAQTTTTAATTTTSTSGALA